jgi:acyl dehydratase
MSVPEEGDVHAVERTFTTEEVRQFAELSGDTQPQHVEPDEEGRLMVHGLLTATLPTQVGGDLEVLAHTMDLSFHRPVYTGDRITCEWTNESVTERGDRYELSASVVCRVDGREVLTGEIEGLVRAE